MTCPSEKLSKNCSLCNILFYKKDNESKLSWHFRKYCSRNCTNNAKVGVVSKKKGIPTGTCWNKGLKGVQVAWNKGIHYEQVSNEKNYLWKGLDASPEAKHEWIRRRLGRPSKCEHCGTTEKRMYHWANISGEYKRDLTDYMRLCVPCHKRYDLDKIALHKNKTTV